MHEFWEGFKRGAKETPRGFFAPLIALLRFMNWVTEYGMSRPDDQHKDRL